jgi:PAP2 superfamily
VTDAVNSSPQESSEAVAETEPPRGADYYGLRWWREILYIVAFYLVYSWIRNQFGSEAVSIDHAFHNARRVIDLENGLGLYVEPHVQSWFVTGDWSANGSVALEYGFPGAKLFLEFWNVFYGTFHFIVTAGTLLWLFVRFPATYRKWRNILMFTTAAALVGFSLFPLMPPRLLADCGTFGACATRHDFVDSLAHVGSLWSFDSGTMQKVSNQYAAMPSLHFAWSMWCFLALYRKLRSPWTRALIAVYPWATLFAIVVTANHFWLDAAGGALILSLGYLVGTWSTQRFDRWRESRASTAP